MLTTATAPSADRASPFAARSLVTTLVAAAPLAGLLWLSGEVSILAATGAMMLLVFVVMSVGSLLLRLAGAADMPATAAWVLGLVASALAVLALATAFDLLAFSAFAVWTAVVLGLSAFVKAPASGAHAGRSEVAALLLCGAATLFWCRDLAEAPQILWRDGVLAAWVDQFIHGATISQFGDVRAAGRQAIQLADMPRPFYHYASYVLPAALAWPLDMPGLPLATSVWVPLGFFTLCAGAYSLGRSLAGSWGGVTALAALVLLPDPAGYGVHNLAFSFHWSVLSVPGGSYGVGIALLSLAFLHRWAKGPGLRPLVASGGLLAALLLVRAHIFVLAVPALLASAAVVTDLVRRRKLAFFAAAAVALALFVFGYYGFVPDAVPALAQFLDATDKHLNQLVTVRATWLPARVLLVLPAALGVFIVLYPFSVLLVHRSRGLEAIDFVPVALLVCYLLLMVSAPVPRHGDATELTQRPLVLLYAVVAVWTAAGIASWFAQQGGLGATRVRLWLCLIAAAWLMGVLSYTIRDHRWTRVHPLVAGLPQAASFLRREWQPGDVLAVQGLKPGRVHTDLAIQLVSLSGMPAYLARPFIHVSRGGRTKLAALERLGELAQVADDQHLPAALARLRELGVQWYVVAGASGPRWDPQRRGAAFVEGDVAVYSTGRGSP